MAKQTKAPAKSTAKKAPAKKVIDWSSKAGKVVIIGDKSKHLDKGKEYKTSAQNAKVLVESGQAKLKE